MKKTYLYIALLMGASTLFSSCSDFLDREPITAPNGYMLALSYEGHVGLGLDTGEGPDYPFTEKTNCFSEDYTTGKFTYTEEHDIKRSLMIRGIGILIC